MDHFEYIYANCAREYHEMIVPEDVDKHLFKALTEIVDLKNKRILDLGTGTGRLPLLLDKISGEMIALDLNLPMLLEQKKQRDTAAGVWPLIQADMRRLPFKGSWAEVITAGWAIGHLRAWYAEDWQKQIGKILLEMQRLVVKGGTLIIMETLSTGSPVAQPPTAELAELYNWFEGEWGYTRKQISTDYLYESVEEAVERTEFFFGSEMAEQIRLNNWSRLPEWTGIWHKTY